MNAFVGPGTGRYLEHLTEGLNEQGVEADLLVMRSNGGVASVAEAAERPVTLMLSGPAAGVLGAQWAGALAGRRRLISFDMGGTSADIGLVTEAGITEASARDTHIADYPLLVPMFDIETIGAGGGSIAHVDAAGAFKVGPRSAGAVPGPAAYGLGGDEPTITDAHLVLGRIDPERFLGGEMPLHTERAEAAVDRLADELGMERLEAAAGILTVANANMAQTIRSHHRRARPRPARVRARGLRRRRAAARRRAGRDARRAGGAGPAASRHHLGHRPADLGPALRQHGHGLRGRGRGRRRGVECALRRARRRAAGAAAARRRAGGADRALPRLPLRRPGLRAADPGRRRGLHRRDAGRLPPRARGGVRARVQRPDRGRQPARHGHRAATEAGARRRRGRHARAGDDRRGDDGVVASTASCARFPPATCCASGCRSRSRSPAPRSSTSATRRSRSRRAGWRPPRPPARSFSTRSCAA